MGNIGKEIMKSSFNGDTKEILQVKIRQVIPVDYNNNPCGKIKYELYLQDKIGQVPMVAVGLFDTFEKAKEKVIEEYFVTEYLYEELGDYDYDWVYGVVDDNCGTFFFYDTQLDVEI